MEVFPRLVLFYCWLKIYFHYFLPPNKELIGLIRQNLTKRYATNIGADQISTAMAVIFASSDNFSIFKSLSFIIYGLGNSPAK